MGSASAAKAPPVNSAEHNTDSINRLVLFLIVFVLIVFVLMVFVLIVWGLMVAVTALRPMPWCHVSTIHFFPPTRPDYLAVSCASCSWTVRIVCFAVVVSFQILLSGSNLVEIFHIWSCRVTTSLVKCEQSTSCGLPNPHPIIGLTTAISRQYTLSIWRPNRFSRYTPGSRFERVCAIPGGCRSSR
jgi:predicted PurR-regulated permease PerM